MDRKRLARRVLAVACADAPENVKKALIATINIRTYFSFCNDTIGEKVVEIMTESLNALDEKEMALYYVILPMINACL